MNLVNFPPDKLEEDVLNQIIAGALAKITESGAVLAGGHSVENDEPKFGLSVVGVMISARMRGMSLGDVFDGLINGIKGVTVGAIILGLAVTLGNVSEKLGTSSYLIGLTRDHILLVPYILQPLLLFLCMIISFSIGSSWGTYAVVFPIAVPLAYSVNPDPFYITLTFAAIIGGAVFGDQCSPISDTTILSAMVSGADLMDHVNTQLPIALMAAGLAAVIYTIIGYINFG